MNFETIKNNVKVCMFDQYGTVVDMQGGLTEVAGETSDLIAAFVDAIAELESVNLAENQPDEDLLAHARYMHDRVVPAMEAVRTAADRLEKVVADDLWPLPKYSEILFIK